MKKKRKIILIIILFLLIVLLGIVLMLKNNKSEITQYDYTNKIFHYADYTEGYPYSEVYVFLKNGKYFHFISQYDERCDLRAEMGVWKEEGEKIYAKYSYDTYFDGGDFVTTDDFTYFGVRRKNYNIIKKNDHYDIYLDFKISKGEPGDKYMDFLTINSSTYYPIYEFDTEEDLYKKLEEMYGEVFTMLISDSVEIQQ